MKTYSFIGCGAAGASLARGLVAGGARVHHVCDLDPGRAGTLASELGAEAVEVGTLEEPFQGTDAVFIAVPDAQIESTAQALASRFDALDERVFFHLAGRFGASVLWPLGDVGALVGAMHPAVSFPPGAEGGVPKGVTFAVDAKGRALAAARDAADILGAHVVEIGEGDRAAYHAATSMVGNYTVTLLKVASDIVEDAGVPREASQRLVAQLALSALSRAKEVGPEAALSGPIRRGDAQAVADHLMGLDGSVHRELYRQLGLSTLDLARGGNSPSIESLAKLERILGIEHPAKKNGQS